MAFLSFLDPVLNLIFNPLINLSPLWGIAVISVILSVIITVIYKYTTNQDLMRDLKKEMKEFQNEVKALRDDPQKAMAVQKRAMETNMKYMMQSFKPMFFTFIPIILIFGWLNTHLAYEPILPDTEFTTTVTTAKDAVGVITLVVPDAVTLVSSAEQEIINKQASWTLKGAAGEYLLEYNYNSKSYTKDLLITTERAYKPVESRVSSPLKTIKINNNPVKVMNLFGWKLGWLGTYIIFSIISSMVLRKLLKVY